MRDMEFAFNDKDFSDRVLHIEIIADSSNSKSDSEGSDSDVVCDSKPKRKNMDRQKRTNIMKQKGEVKTLHVASCILASHSAFFFKLFKNGMKESAEREVSLKIDASEEAAFMDLLKYMYNNTLSASTVPELLKVFMVADKFEVTSCMRYCSELLQGMPLSLESAILYFELPPNVFMGQDGKTLQNLRDASEQYVVKDFKSFTKSKEKAMDLPLSALEVVLGSNGLHVASEEQIFDFIVKWGRAHYPILKERQEILTKRLARFIYFPYLCMSTIEEIQASPDFDRKEVTKLVLESLYSNSGPPYGQRINISPATSLRYLDRVYQFLPVKTMESDSSQPHCVVYFYLTKKDYVNLYCYSYLYSQRFRVAGRWLILRAECVQDIPNKLQHFGLFVQMPENAETCTVDYEFAVMDNEEPLNEFRSIYKVESCTFKGGDFKGKGKLFSIPLFESAWSKSGHFINEILHLRVELTINDSNG